MAIYRYRNPRRKVCLKELLRGKREGRGQENEKEREREEGKERKEGKTTRKAARRNSLKGNGRGVPREQKRWMRRRRGDACRGAHHLTARPLHSTHPSPFAGRFELRPTDRVPEDRILSIVVILWDPARFRSAPLRSAQARFIPEEDPSRGSPSLSKLRPR